MLDDAEGLAGFSSSLNPGKFRLFDWAYFWLDYGGKVLILVLLYVSNYDNQVES